MRRNILIWGPLMLRSCSRILFYIFKRRLCILQRIFFMFQYLVVSLGRTEVTLSNATLTTLTATWTPAGGDLLTGYEVLYHRDAGDDGDADDNVVYPVSEYKI